MEPVMAIYVLPTEEGQPPRAVVGMDVGEGIVGPMATWSTDTGCWMMNGVPVPPELSEAITAHAKNLGVEWHE